MNRIDSRDMNGVTAALLYESLPEPDAAGITSAINRSLSVFGLSFEADALRPDEMIAMSNGQLRISMRAVRSPLPASRLTAALTSRFTRARPNDYASPVAAHAAAMIVSGAAARDCAAEGIPADTLIVLCHAGVASLIARTLPLMVHWRQTDMLYLPAEIPPLRGIGFPVALATRPEIIRARPDSRGRPRMGFLADQSERYFGKPLLVEPTAHPLPDCLTLVDFCILRKLVGEDLLADGTTLSLPGPVEVAVRHLASTPTLPLGAISLTIRAPVPDAHPACRSEGGYVARRSVQPPVARLEPRTRRAP